MKKLLIAAGIVIVGAIIAVNVMKDTSNAIDVRVAAVESQDLTEVVSASGRIQPKTKVDITSEVTGEIIDIRVREGERVEAGQLLIVLDTVQLKTDLDQAKYAVDEFNARLASAKTALDQAKDEYERQKSLFERDLTSERVYKDAKYAYENALASYNAMKAQTLQAESRYEKQLDNLSKATMIAPMTGVITFVDCEVGEIAPAQTAFTQGKTLMTISNMNVFEVEVEVDETEINKVELGQDTDIEVDAFPDTVFSGSVVEIGNTAITSNMGSQDQSTNFRVKIVFKDADVKIRPGMSATVDITTARRDGVLAVPFSAIVMRELKLDSLEAARKNRGSAEAGSAIAAETDGEDTAPDGDQAEEEDLRGVFVVREGMAHFVPVETGIADQRNIQVVSGLTAQDTVVSGPYSALRRIADGDAVNAEVEKKDNAKGRS